MPDPPGHAKPDSISHSKTNNMSIQALIHQLVNADSLHAVSALLQQLFPRLDQENILLVMRRISEKPLLLEFVLASFPNQSALSSWLIHNFPKDAAGFKSSFFKQMLLRLSRFFVVQNDLPIPAEYSASDDLSSAERLVSQAPDTLELLSQMTFLDERQRNNAAMFTSSKQTRKGHKKMTSWQGVTTLENNMDPAMLSDFGLEVPCTILERDRATSMILASMKDCLSLYTLILSHPSVAKAVKTHFQGQLPASKTQNEQDLATNNEGLPAGVTHNFIQPLKGALYFSNVEGFGDWRILISNRVHGELRGNYRKNRKMFKIYIKKIRELSHGHFSPDNQKRLAGFNNIEIPVYEAKMTGDTRLVAYPPFVSNLVIKLFGIFTHAQMDERLLHFVGGHFAKKGREYRKCCIYRQKPDGSGNDIYTPATWPLFDIELEEEASDEPELFSPLSKVEEVNLDSSLDQNEVHSLLVLAKFSDFSHELLQSMPRNLLAFSQNPLIIIQGILANLDVSFPFQVSHREEEIIRHPDSCYVLGRSGTGKTTSMLFKMLWVENTYRLNKDEMLRPRQIFVTKSRVLAQKVEESFKKLLASLYIKAMPFQELQKLAKSDTGLKRADLIDVDDEVNWRSDLPRRFSELQDHHFPLFLTYDRLCDMIEGDTSITSASGLSRSSGSSQLITFEHFRYQYWPHFPQPLIKRLDPALVFSEIIGIIKGSEETLAMEGPLSREAYEGSYGQYSMFESQRSAIYSIFEIYQTRKRQRGERDNADRTHSLLKLIKGNGIKGKKIGQLYVDEVQDNLLIDALVLRSLTHNSNGLFWAGDTAQTISVGSAFRFDDLKAFLYRVEQQKSQYSKHQAHLIHQTQPPKVFQLVTNWRSHAGIVNCAHSVIELMTAFWPHSIDNLQPEKGMADGSRPLFLIDWDNDNVQYEQFLFGSSESQLEFGAEQCILVRDEAARKRLQQQVGNIGLIMTLYESKGLEFDDVLLWNFFEDSDCDLSQWRLILNAIEPGSEIAVPFAPQFDPLRHAPICFELKFLYVALTRARMNLWVADKSGKGDPMKMYWLSQGLIETRRPDDKLPQLANTIRSSVEAWASKGQELFHRKCYHQAKHCFDRANQPWEAAVAEAYLLREEARKVATSTKSRSILQKRQESFSKAAKAFITCSKDAPNNKLVYILRAAECFQEAGEELIAARTYLDAHDFDTAAKLFRKLGRFDDTVNIIKCHSQHMDQDTVESLKEVARLFYFKEEQLIKARDLFTTEEEELDYLEELDLDLAHADVLVSLGRYGEAAQIHANEGRPLSAIPLFLKDMGNLQSIQQVKATLLSVLWGRTTIGCAIADEAFTTTILQWLGEISIGQHDKDDQELLMFRTLLKSEKTIRDMPELANKFLMARNIPAALLCLDHHFSVFPSPKLQSIQDLGTTLSMFFTYIRILQDIAFRPHLFDGVVLEKLFGCKPTIGDTFSLSPETLLSYHTIRQSNSTEQGGISVSKSELYSILRITLCNRLQERISDQAESCKRASQFSTCLNWAVAGFCNRGLDRGGCPSEHVSIQNLSTEWYNGRVRLHLLQVLIHQVRHSLGHSNESMEPSLAHEKPSEKHQKRRLLDQFYDSLFPPHYCLGTPEYLSPSLIPEWSHGIQVVRDWIRELAYNLDLRGNPRTFTYLVKGVRLSFYFDGSNASFYWRQSLCTKQHIAAFVRPPGVPIARDVVLSTEKKQFYSLSVGICAIRHILKSYPRLSIHPGALCDMVESACASFSVSYRLKNPYTGGFHGLVLPGSWISPVLLNPMMPNMQLHKGLQYELVNNVGELLEVIYTGRGAEFLLFEGSNLASITSSNVRAVFITRLIRAICILGCNIYNNELRKNIFYAVTSLRRVELDRRFPSLYHRFIECRDWDSLVNVLRAMTQGALSDGLVQLHDHRRGPLPANRAPGITWMEYHGEIDLRSRLARESTPSVSNTPAEDNGGHQIASRGKEIPGVSDAKAPVAETEGTLAESRVPQVGYLDRGNIDQGIANGGDGDGDIEEMMTEIPSQEHEPSEEEKCAAILIQKKYRKMIGQRANRDLKGLAAARHGLFARCLDCVLNSTNWEGHTLYQRMFLGPLPHILFCLETIISVLDSQKIQTKKRLLSGSNHEELDALGPQLTRLQNSHKFFKRLRALLDPSSEVHKNRDVLELKRLVQESNNGFRNLPILLPQEIAVDLAMGFKGIIGERKVKNSQIGSISRPTLVTDKDYDISY